MKKGINIQPSYVYYQSGQMTFYLLPKAPFFIQKYIDCIETDYVPPATISNSLSSYLYEIKEKIEKREKDWDIFKKYTNPYEYVHTGVPYKKRCISKYKPLSRSYFKMIEIINTFGLHFTPTPIRTFHLAEGPGGFIEAVSTVRKNANDIYIGITLMDDKNDPNIPAWKKSDAFLRNNRNVYIEYGADNTGNILSLENYTGCKDQYKSSMDLITADGGFDFSLDFNMQEMNIAKLLFAQVCYAVMLQKKGGSFILKVFDCFMHHSIDILYILSSFYNKVYMMKPYTSRYANSEKYIVCKDFIYSSCDSFFPFLHRAFEKMTSARESRVPMYISRFLNIPVPAFYISKVEEYNAILGQQQLENIHYTITLIDNKHNQDKIDALIKGNIQKCIQWCTRYGIPYNIFVANNNNI
jgi:23S rRNA U2552 (ribose-2'-O)-methylase RlmE/FtsJ